ncbi:helix-turn-helix transcriptional regulator [Prauserella cavernicola]|nr:helix-turn-helix transcriptional regulator [Prauserella cavernicola]
MDRDFARPLDVPALARIALMSPTHFTRSFRTTFGETPHRYLQRRRIERAMSLLRNPAPTVTEVAAEVGFESLGTFSRTFRTVVGLSPTEFRASSTPLSAPDCFVRSWTRPSRFG